nr:unnamed protein product [Callosobruchus chinensis]
MKEAALASDEHQITVMDYQRYYKSLAPPNPHGSGMSYFSYCCLPYLIIVPLTKLFNMCIRSSTFPKILKISKVIPIFQNGSKVDALNYP